MKIFALFKKTIVKLTNVNLLIEPNIRFLVTYIRAIYFLKIKRSLKTLESEDAIGKTVIHNLKSILPSNNRIGLLLYPLSVIESLNKDSKILIIGPRNENDLFFLRGLGFHKKNIVGLDLISYVENIKIGDMHSIPFESNSFDCVVCGWTLSYSEYPQKAATEILRVVKNNGLIAIGVEYSLMTKEDDIKALGYVLQGNSSRINSTHQILNLFINNVKEVYFSHDAPNKKSHSALMVKDVSNVASIFSINK